VAIFRHGRLCVGARDILFGGIFKSSRLGIGKFNLLKKE
jgi:hypothetical protein